VLTSNWLELFHLLLHIGSKFSCCALRHRNRLCTTRQSGPGLDDNCKVSPDVRRRITEVQLRIRASSSTIQQRGIPSVGSQTCCVTKQYVLRIWLAAICFDQCDDASCRVIEASCSASVLSALGPCCATAAALTAILRQVLVFAHSEKCLRGST
jgi:hypothetical protein